MSMIRPGRTVLLVAAVAAAALLAWAWVDGGRRPVDEIAEPVAIPESAR